jgi:hypothetical protein
VARGNWGRLEAFLQHRQRPAELSSLTGSINS